MRGCPLVYPNQWYAVGSSDNEKSERNWPNLDYSVDFHFSFSKSLIHQPSFFISHLSPPPPSSRTLTIKLIIVKLQSVAAKKTASNSLLAVIWGAHRIQPSNHPFDLQTNTTTKQKKCIVFKKKCNFAPIKKH